MPLHVNVFAGTLTDLGGRTPLHAAVLGAGRLPWEVTVDIVPPYTHVPQPALLWAVGALREQGFRISADGVGDGDVPLRLLIDMAPDLVKLDASLLARPAAVRAMRTLCEQLGALLSVEGVEAELQCAAALSAGAQLTQGEPFAPPARLPAVHVPAALPRPPGGAAVRAVAAGVRAGRRAAARHGVGGSGAGAAEPGRRRCPECCSWTPPVCRYGPRTARASCCRCRAATAMRSTPTGRPPGSVIRRGPWASTPPRGSSSTWWPSAAGTARRTAWRWSTGTGGVGVVRLADLVRALAESRIEEAAGLNPLTRLPGSDAITGEVDRRIADGRTFTLSRLDVDHFKQVNDGAGFAARDELIRLVGSELQHAASGSTRLGHIGGDDFLVLTDPEVLDPLARSVLDAPWSAGGRPITLSLATVVCSPGSVADRRQTAACPAPLKNAAKALQGASWVLGRAGLPRYEIPRGSGAAAARAGCTVAEPGIG